VRREIQYFKEIRTKIEEANYPSGWGASSLKRKLANIWVFAIEKEDWLFAKEIASFSNTYFEKTQGQSIFPDQGGEIISLLLAKNQNLDDYSLGADSKLYQFIIVECEK
jgi:hypothetical protein